MNPKAQRIAIAEACGWKVYRDETSIPSSWVVSDGRARITLQSHKTENAAFLLGIPDYLNDLNAIHVAEKVLTYDQKNTYLNILHELCRGEEVNDVDDDFAWCAATAAQRSEALIKTLGLWVETDRSDPQKLQFEGNDKVSSCCGAPAVGSSEDIGMCPSCKEHCEYEEVER